MLFYFVRMVRFHSYREARSRPLRVLGILGISLLIAGCGDARKEHHWFAMDTGISITLYGRGETRASSIFRKLEDETRRLEKSFSDYDAFSAISGIRGRKGDTLKVESEIWKLLHQAINVSVASGGAYNVNMHRLKALWGMGTGQISRVPDSAEIDSVIKLCTGSGPDFFLPVSLSKNNRLIFNCDHVRLDLGAIVKGYAADRLSELLLNAGFRDYLIAVGGEIRFNGTKPSGHWRVGIRHPRQANELAAVLSSESAGSISSSGDYERFFIQDNVRYHHIFNPHTGYPARRYCAITVVANKGIFSDALSTALFVMDTDSGASLLEQYGALALWMIELPGGELCVRYSPGMKPWLKTLNLGICPEKTIEAMEPP